MSGLSPEDISKYDFINICRRADSTEGFAKRRGLYRKLAVCKIVFISLIQRILYHVVKTAVRIQLGRHKHDRGINHVIDPGDCRTYAVYRV